VKISLEFFEDFPAAFFQNIHDSYLLSQFHRNGKVLRPVS